MSFFNTAKGKEFLSDAEGKYKSRLPIKIGTLTKVSATDIDDKKRRIKQLRGIKDKQLLTKVAIRSYLTIFELVIESAANETN